PGRGGRPSAARGASRSCSTTPVSCEWRPTGPMEATMRARDTASRRIGGEYLTCTLGEEVYALPIPAVREVTEYLPLTPVPGVPSSIRGVVNLRGTVVPVVDLAAKFGFAEAEVTKWTCLVIVDAAFD